jgi:outer membrane cobalamin receptor
MLYPQTLLTGKVLDNKTRLPIEYAVVSVPERELWATTNERGEFRINLVGEDRFTLIISCLGYMKNTTIYENSLSLAHNNIFYLKQDNLQLSEVVVTAQKQKSEIATTYAIDRNAINHIQANSITDVMALLPGAATSKSLSLTSEQRIGIRSQNATELDNASFGTAIEVDGVRMSNNSTYTSGVEGTDIRNISMANIESIEIVTGLPSVEHGDLTAGMVKINTKKGKSPLEIEIINKPFIKSYSVQKGFLLGKNAGTLNASVEHTSSISNRASPYTTYNRNGVNLAYQNTLRLMTKPVILTYTLAGNSGGYNSESDPDAFTSTYTKIKDNVLRSSLKLNWLLNTSWITNLEFFSSVNYSDKLTEKKTNHSSSSAVAAIHTTEAGYHIGTNYDDNPEAAILMIPAGYWYDLGFDDDKPVTYSLELKAKWNKEIGKVSNKVLLGAGFDYAGNYGRGVYYDDMRYAPTYRSYRYDIQPFIKTLALYAEDKINFPVLGRDMQVQAGVRADIVAIRGSEYGVSTGLSPRINSRYTILDRRSGFISNLTFYANLGDAVKLPSANILYPRQTFTDKPVFASGTLSDGSVFYAYYTQPERLVYNPDLKWERNRKSEIGIDMKTSIARISLSAFYDRTYNPYKYVSSYSPYEYKYTDRAALNDVPISFENRVFNIDQQSGVVTVSDRSGTYASQELAYKTLRQFKSSTYYANGSPVEKSGINWLIDFEQIKALKTSVRVDGAYFQYKGLDKTLEVDWPTSSNMSDGNPYKYLAYYVGSASWANGSETAKLTTNVTFTTHIPAVRMIFTLRLEACFYDYSQNLSQYNGGTRSYVIDNKDSFVPSTNNTNIYAGNVFVATYPLYYTTIDDMDTQIPFLETFLWAKDNDKTLYDELAKMVLKSNYNYYFNASRNSVYYSANINLTKEIGNHVSLSFMANNFFNNMKQVTNSWTGSNLSLYQSGKIPQLSYGISLRIKF